MYTDMWVSNKDECYISLFYVQFINCIRHQIFHDEKMTWVKISSSLYPILILISIYVLTIATVTNHQNVSNSDCNVQRPNESNILWYEKYQVVDSVHATFRL